MSIYKLLWDDFCSWLLELVKPDYGQPVDQQTYTEIIALFEKNLRILHPFMPFLTEELWHFIKDRKTDEALTISAWPQTKKFNQKLIADFELAQQIIVGIRNFRNEKNISYKESISLYINTEATDFSFESSIVKLGGLTAINFTSPPEELVGGSFRINNLELFIPTDAAEDPEAEKEKLTLELNYTRGFLASVEKKLSNERFVANAPEKVIALERKKAADAKEKIVLLEKNLALL
jgi:valyl-tRNA synthetase